MSGSTNAAVEILFEMAHVFELLKNPLAQTLEIKFRVQYLARLWLANNDNA